jgi:hypothetical protein
MHLRSNMRRQQSFKHDFEGWVAFFKGGAQPFPFNHFQNILVAANALVLSASKESESRIAACEFLYWAKKFYHDAQLSSLQAIDMRAYHLLIFTESHRATAETQVAMQRLIERQALGPFILRLSAGLDRKLFQSLMNQLEKILFDDSLFKHTKVCPRYVNEMQTFFCEIKYDNQKNHPRKSLRHITNLPVILEDETSESITTTPTIAVAKNSVVKDFFQTFKQLPVWKKIVIGVGILALGLALTILSHGVALPAMFSGYVALGSSLGLGGVCIAAPLVDTGYQTYTKRNQIITEPWQTPQESTKIFDRQYVQQTRQSPAAPLIVASKLAVHKPCSIKALAKTPSVVDQPSSMTLRR